MFNIYGRPSRPPEQLYVPAKSKALGLSVIVWDSKDFRMGIADLLSLATQFSSWRLLTIGIKVRRSEVCPINFQAFYFKEVTIHESVERLSRVVSDVGSNANLNMVGRTNGLDTLINKNPADKDAPVGAVTMAGTIEAILGAVYLDSDMKCVTEVMQNLALMPRLVRRTGMKVPMSDSMKSPVASTPSVQDQGEPETAPRDLDESLVKVMKSSQELEKAMREHSIVMQLKQRLDQNAQSTP